VGRRLREARERAGLSQRQLSFTGCSPAYISRIEAGDRIPSLQLLREMGRRLGVTEDYLATGSEARDESALLVEAELAMRLDERDLARELYGKALEGAANPEARARSLSGLGQLAFREGRPRDAIGYLEEARALSHQAVQDDPSAVETLGRAYAAVDRLEAATELFRNSLEVARDRQDPVEAVRFAVLLANALIDRTDFAEAGGLLERTLQEAPATRDPIVRARVYWSQSRLYSMQNDHLRAARHARKALNILELTEHTYYTAQAHQLLAHIELDRERPDEALALLDRGRELLEDGGTPVDHALFNLERARALIQLGRSEEAAALAMEANGLLADASPQDAGRGYALVGDVYAALGEGAKAIEVYELAAEVLSAFPSRYLVEVYQKLADLLEAEDRKDEALEVLKQAVTVRGQAVS
jgi:tetratricopeptide (TPR) repeat protein